MREDRSARRLWCYCGYSEAVYYREWEDIATSGVRLANAFSVWPARRLLQRAKAYASFSAWVLISDASGSCSVSSGSRKG
jgi:hypothetical protein